MSANVLSHTLDKVRYFRNLLITDDCRVRIIIGSPGLFSALRLAVEDMKDVPTNQLVMIVEGMKLRLTRACSCSSKKPILIYVRRLRDTFAEALINEYDCSDCSEIVEFDIDPTSQRPD